MIAAYTIKEDDEIIALKQCIGLVDISPKDSIPFYPSISFDEAQKKVKTSVENISKHSGKDADKVSVTSRL